MTATLGSLKLTAAQKPSHITPIQQRRNKLAKRLVGASRACKGKGGRKHICTNQVSNSHRQQWREKASGGELSV